MTQDRADRDPTADLDWDRMRTLLRNHLLRRAESGDRDHLDDLVQEACVRLLRASRRGPVESPDALAATIARRTWVDHIRRRTRWRNLFVAETGQEAPALSGGPAFGDVRDRLQFIVTELLESNGSHGCLDLARAYFAERDWKTVAAAAGRSYAAVRKQWSRCVTEVRDLIRRDPHLARTLDPGA
jgi:DNA-directed RNA polymerase specialized sigma24 family protein